jgi:signal transduction histidine kinase/ligand-binding sensor domain-containing protein/DNA-binding response OmpR family regulator
MRINLFRYIILFILSILFLPLKLYSQENSLVIQHLTRQQGLSSSSVNCIIQDENGYLWFSTRMGIDRYDGYNFESYVNRLGDASSFINTNTAEIYIDKQGTLWCGSYDGLERFNDRTNSFTNFLPNSSKNPQTSANFVFYMVEDHKGTFWVSTARKIYKFNRRTGKFSMVETENDTSYVRYVNIYVPFIDKDNLLWFGAFNGLDRYNYETGKVMHYWQAPLNSYYKKTTSSEYTINAICDDKDGNLWLGTNYGLVKFNKKANTFINYIPNPSVHTVYDVNCIAALCFDSSGLLWLGTYHGILTFDTKTKRFSPRFINKAINDYNLGNEEINALYFDRSGILWVGTEADGVYKVILRKPAYNRYLPGNIEYVVKGTNGTIWVQRGIRGWVKIDTKNGKVTSTNFSGNSYIFSDSSGTLYTGKDGSTHITRLENGRISTFDLLKEPTVIYFKTPGGMWYGGFLNGLYYLDLKTGKSKEVLKTDVHITAIFKDSSDNIWAATYYGKIICYNPLNKKISEFVSDPANPSTISGRLIYAIYQDKKDRLWFATDAGLNEFIPSTKTFIHFNEKDGLSGNIVYNILEDDHNNLWIGTDKGISRFNPETNQFKNFDILQGLSSSGWYNHLAVKMDDGEMFFGRSYGLIGFYPDKIRGNNYIPPVVITSLNLFDKPIPFGSQIKLPYDKNFLSFEFASLNYFDSQKNQYAYKMDGVDKDWVYSGTRHYASYPNLAPGTYTFRVKGSNNDGIWNEKGTSLLIIISPPWWKTTWAYISYAVILLLTFYGLRRYELNRAKLKNKIKLDAAVLKEKEETEKIKSRFFANISHEFRTPLTLILGPAEKIISRSPDENTLKDAGIIKRNSRRLLKLVNQLLDLSKLDAGRLKLEASKNNIVSFVKGVALSFESLSEEKDITLKISTEKDLIEVYFDRDKMTKILSNILSNAFKFTQQNGKITISINAFPSSKAGNQIGHVEIKIRDTGIGIPPEEIPKLFDRFYQVDSSITKEYEGTGIGLALTKELVELHHGTVNVQSEKNRWTEFTLTFPLGNNHLKDEEILPGEKIITGNEPDDYEDYYSDDNIKYAGNNDIEEIRSAAKEKTIILVVEDNYDMREYIKESLSDGYIVEEAVNGEQGVRKAEFLIPDLIISDMMMPKMDGNELTRALKNSEKTSHIPIIILTAKSGQENKLEGLEKGADDYLTKPFDIKELQLRIKNLINLRRKLQEKLSKIGNPAAFASEKDIQFIQSKPLKLRSIDEKFLEKIRKIVNERMSDENFSTEELGREVGMSRAQVFRKIKGLTGKSPSVYIRSLRLQKAKSMIENGDGNISEIAYSVGFSSPIYFSKCFKEEFGYSPRNITS